MFVEAAVILDDQHTLTAAHCIQFLPNTVGRVRETHKIQVGVGNTTVLSPLHKVRVKGASSH